MSAAPDAPAPELRIRYPDWVAEVVDWGRPYPDDESRMRVAIDVARANVEHGTGGPFGAAIVEAPSGRLVAVGMNLVVRYNNSTLHGEMVAFMMAEQRLGSFTLAGAPGGPTHELFTSCDPCAMCLGAILWAGVSRVVCGAHRDDASRLAFDEGPVFPQSYEYLAARGVTVVHGVLREEARAVMEAYRTRGGKIYNR